MQAALFSYLAKAGSCNAKAGGCSAKAGGCSAKAGGCSAKAGGCSAKAGWPMRALHASATLENCSRKNAGRFGPDQQ